MHMDKYEDIINLPRHISKTRQPMPIRDRAAQFASFAALTGYGEAITETARLTDKKLELTAEQESLLNERLQILAEHLSENPPVKVIYFVPDEKKEGGAYVKYSGRARTLDEVNRELVFTDKTNISVDNIFYLDGELFGSDYN